MRILVTGAGGMLAHDLLRCFADHGDEVVGLGRSELDVTDAEQVARTIGERRPDVVIQGAAYTAVDRAEAEPEAALRVNVEGTRHVARACQKLGAVFVYPSTDYVFAGDLRRPYRPDDAPDPVNVYGRSKWQGEIAAAEAGRALVVRTSWLYGAGGANFVGSIARLAMERDALDVVDDQIGRPTWTMTLAEVIRTLLNAGLLGTFHASDGGNPVSWAGFAGEIVRRIGAQAEIRPIVAADLARPAIRPNYSVLDLGETERAMGRALPDWKDSLARYLGERVR